MENHDVENHDDENVIEDTQDEVMDDADENELEEDMDEDDEDNTENDDAREHIITERMRMLFWNEMEHDMKKKNYVSFLLTLEQLSNKICEVIPRRVDIHKNIEENIDIEFISQMLKHDALEESYIYNVVQFLITQLKELDSIEDEPMYEIWRTQVNRRLNEQDVRLHVLLPIFLRECIHRIAKIEFEIQMFKESELYKMIKERREQREQEEMS